MIKYAQHHSAPLIKLVHKYRFVILQIVLGSDYPFPLGEFTAESRGKEYAAGQLVDSMESWTEEQKKKVFQDNALEWLGLCREDFE